MNTAGEMKFDLTFEWPLYKQVYIYNAAQTPIWTASGNQLTYNINLTGLAAGDYYLLVYRNSNDRNSYQISNFDIPCNNAPAVISADGPTTFCAGGSVTLSTTETYATYNWSNGQHTNSINVNSSGNYYLVGIDNDGCSHTSNTINVTVNPNPNPLISAGGPTTFCNGGSVVLSSNIATGNLWSTGATTQSITVSASGSYSVTNTNANGCSGTSNTIAVTVQTCNTWYQDADGDGYGNPSVVLHQPTQPAGYVTNNTDCDDTNASVHQTFGFYTDSDGDGYGSGAVVQLCVAAASPAPAGYSTNNTDCAPTDATRWRTATVYQDADGDGYSTGASQSICYGTTLPAGYITSPLGTDCNDANAAIHPGATEICGNGIDENCNGMADDACSNPDTDGDGVPDASDCAPNDATKWQSANVYIDADGDGFTVGAMQSICYGATLPAGYSLTSAGTDCDDTNSSIGSTVATPVASASGSTHICGTGSVSLSSSATTGNQWYNGASAISGATDQTYAATAPGNYHVVATAGTCTSAASNTISVTQSSAAGNTALSNTSDNNIALIATCDESGWTYYVNPADPARYLFAVQWDPTNTNLNTAAKQNAVPRIMLMASYTSAENTASTPPKATYAMQRYWNISNAGTLQGPINIRFFYNDAEKQAVINAANSFETATGSVQATPAWFKTVGVNYDPAQHVTPDGITNAIILNDVNTSANTINGILYAQFNSITSLSGGTFAASVGNATVLPVKLVNFTGSNVSATVNRLSATFNCSGSDRVNVELQHGASPAAFNTVYTQVLSAANCHDLMYNDAKTFNGANYYRLKMIDEAGRISFSNVVLLHNTTKGIRVSVMPNPVTSIANINISSSLSTMLSLSIKDMSGKTVLNTAMNIATGENIRQINISHLAKGVYILSVKGSEGLTATVKLIKN